MFKTEDNVHVGKFIPDPRSRFFSIPDPGIAKHWF
jgi:hypothetical protein